MTGDNHAVDQKAKAPVRRRLRGQEQKDGQGDRVQAAQTREEEDSPARALNVLFGRYLELARSQRVVMINTSTAELRRESAADVERIMEAYHTVRNHLGEAGG